jgi:alkyl sulfatase BDS1-like metallo-beta-lactamase superfamily hydrolase
VHRSAEALDLGGCDAVGSEPAKRGRGGSMAETVQEYFEGLPSRVPPENTAGMTNSYLFEIRDVGTWLVAVNDGKVTVEKQDGEEAEADVRIAMSEDVFHKLVAGEQNPMRAVMTGKIRVKGNMGAASKLQKILG